MHFVANFRQLCGCRHLHGQTVLRQCDDTTSFSFVSRSFSAFSRHLSASLLSWFIRFLWSLVAFFNCWSSRDLSCRILLVTCAKTTQVNLQQSWPSEVLWAPVDVSFLNRKRACCRANYACFCQRLRNFTDVKLTYISRFASFHQLQI